MTRPSTSPDSAPAPPGPPLPAFVQTLALLFARARFVETCRRRYGDAVAFRTLFGPPFVMVFDPELVRQVFRSPPDRLCAGRANRGVEPLHGRHSLMVLGDDDHLRQRRLMLPTFQGERMRGYETVIAEATDRAIEAWPVGAPFALLPSMYALTLDVAIGAIFGVEPGPRADELRDAMRRVLDAVGPRRFGRDRSRVDDLIHGEIRRARVHPDLDRRPDVLAGLLRARDDEGGAPLGDEELHDELVTLLIAGHETTAVSLAWAFELLLRSPRVRERLRESLAAGEEAYLEAVVKETLRLRPAAAGIGRLVHGAPLVLDGHTVSPGTEVTASIEAIHRRGDLFPEPEAFRPERFLGPDPPDGASWIPFGGGVRRCIGAAFAAYEMRIAIARVLERADLRPVGPPERSRRRAITPPTGRAFARALRRGRRPLPGRGVRVVQLRPPRARSARALDARSEAVAAAGRRETRRASQTPRSARSA